MRTPTPFLHTVAFRGPALFSENTDGGLTWSKRRVIFDPGQNDQNIGNQILVPTAGPPKEFRHPQGMISCRGAVRYAGDDRHLRVYLSWPLACLSVDSDVLALKQVGRSLVRNLVSSSVAGPAEMRLHQHHGPAWAVPHMRARR